MHRPALLVLDEPTSGLDPLIQHEFHRILGETADEGRTVFLSSHVLSEVQEIAQRVGIIRNGTLAAVEDVGVLKSRAVRGFEFHFSGSAPAYAWDQIPGVLEAQVSDAVVRFTVEGSVDPLLKVAVQNEVVDIISHESDLEELFLSYYGGEEGE